MPPAKQKIYAYVDESGQDTAGRLFVVGVLVLENELAELIKQLEQIEAKTKKRNFKWNRAHYLYRRAYIEELPCCVL